jgi:ABC-type proline/glycine betaine transport system substrate-binding protein
MRLKTSLAYAAAFTIGLCSASTFAIAKDSKDPIKIVTNNWTSQLELSNVVGQILHAQGDAFEYKSSDTQLQFTAIASGDIDFQGEVWEGSMAESFNLSPNYASVVSRLCSSLLPCWACRAMATISAACVSQEL